MLTIPCDFLCPSTPAFTSVSCCIPCCCIRPDLGGGIFQNQVANLAYQPMHQWLDQCSDVVLPLIIFTAALVTKEVRSIISAYRSRGFYLAISMRQTEPLRKWERCKGTAHTSIVCHVSPLPSHKGCYSPHSKLVSAYRHKQHELIFRPQQIQVNLFV